MLVRLFGRNFGVFRDDFSLSMEALDLRSDRDRGYFTVKLVGERKPLRLLRVAALYGPNASGKSTVIRAAAAIRALVRGVQDAETDDARIPQYIPFLLDTARESHPVQLGCEFVVDARLMRYMVHFNATTILTESLAAIVGEHEKPWFQRFPDGSINVDPQHMNEAPGLDFANVVRPGATVLASLSPLKTTLDPIRKAITRSFHLIDASHGPIPWGPAPYSIRMLHENSDARAWILKHLIEPADLGVVKLDTEARQLTREERKLHSIAGESPPADEVVTPVLFHRTAEGDPVALPFELESRGTQMLVVLSGPWHDLVHRDIAVFVDELGSALHPTLLTCLIDAVNRLPKARRSQLILTLHDPSPLESALRRDQVWLTDKGLDGAATLTPLSDFEVRGVHNLKKRYLEGRFGGVPLIARSALLAGDEAE